MSERSDYMKKLVKALQPPKEPTSEELKAQMPQMTVEQLLGLVWMYDGKNEAETLLRLLAQRLESAREAMRSHIEERKEIDSQDHGECSTRSCSWKRLIEELAK